MPRPSATLCFSINFKRRLRVRGYFRATASSYPAVATSRSNYTTAGGLKTGTLSHFQVIYNNPLYHHSAKNTWNKAVDLSSASIYAAPDLSGQNKHKRRQIMWILPRCNQCDRPRNDSMARYPTFLLRESPVVNYYESLNINMTLADGWAQEYKDRKLFFFFFAFVCDTNHKTALQFNGRKAIIVTFYYYLCIIILVYYSSIRL